VSPLDAVVVAALLALPFHWAVQRELARQADPAYLRRHGVVIVSPSALEAHAEPSGSYMGREIWRSVRFKGMEYRFDRIVPARERERTGPGELYVEPGLVYVAV
jgi:hypothetical protein